MSLNLPHKPLIVTDLTMDFINRSLENITKIKNDRWVYCGRTETPNALLGLTTEIMGSVVIPRCLGQQIRMTEDFYDNFDFITDGDGLGGQIKGQALYEMYGGCLTFWDEQTYRPRSLKNARLAYLNEQLWAFVFGHGDRKPSRDYETLHGTFLANWSDQWKWDSEIRLYRLRKGWHFEPEHDRWHAKPKVLIRLAKARPFELAAVIVSRDITYFCQDQHIKSDHKTVDMPSAM